MGRRDALRRLGVVSAGLGLAACTPLRIVLHLYPDDFDRDQELTDQVLRAFVTAVIPGAPVDGRNIIRALRDEAYPLRRYAGFLAADLCRRARDRIRTGAFHHLSLAERTEIIQSAVSGGGTTARLYHGAIFLTQVAFYGGIYDDATGCPLIGFEGRYRFRGVAATTYPDPHRFLCPGRSPDGNPA